MLSKDFIPVIVPRTELERQVYSDIIISSGLGTPVVVEHYPKYESGYTTEEKIAAARKVADTVGEKRSVTIGYPHYLMAFLYDGKDAIIFDRHNDGYNASERSDFNGGNFLLKRKGRKFILGSQGIDTSRGEIKEYSPRKARKSLREICQMLAEEVLLSMDVDVLSGSATRAHGYGDNIFENLMEIFGIKLHMDFEEVLSMSEELSKTRKLIGINISQYSPMLEGPPYRTADLLRTYITSVLRYQ